MFSPVNLSMFTVWLIDIISYNTTYIYWLDITKVLCLIIRVLLRCWQVESLVMSHLLINDALCAWGPSLNMDLLYIYIVSIIELFR